MNKKYISIILIVLLSIYFLFGTGEEVKTPNQTITKDLKNKNMTLQDIEQQQKTLYYKIEDIDQKIKDLEDQKKPLQNHLKKLQFLAKPFINSEKIKDLEEQIKTIETYLKKNVRTLENTKIRELKAQIKVLENEIYKLKN